MSRRRDLPDSGGQQAGSVPDAFQSYAAEPLAQAPAGGLGKQGKLEADLARRAGGETRLIRDRVRVPYHLSGTLRSDPAPGMVTLCVQEPTGGVAQGDRHRLSVTARSDARGHVTTQGATKVHSMAANYAHLDVTLRAEAGAHLEYVPGPTIVNDSARCLQTARIECASDGVVILGDVFVPDGLSDHEAFSFDHYHSRVDADVDGRLVCANAVDLQPATGDPRDPASVGEYSVVGSLYVIAPAVDTDALTERIRNCLADDGAHAGVSALPNEAGACVRVLAAREAEATGAVRTAFDAARRGTLGVGAPDDRRKP